MATADPPLIAALRDGGVHDDELVTISTASLLWRIHSAAGPHVLPWNGFRGYGPLLRFDHHPRPKTNHAKYGIWYGASSPRGAFAEVFQGTRVIDRVNGAPYLSAVAPERPLELLDIGGFSGGT